MSIYYQDAAQGDTTTAFAPINHDAFIYYYKELSALQHELGIPSQDLVATIMRMPDVTKLQDQSDITEEKVRLTNHLRYFRETMDNEGSGVGKKLGFIAQEMGREINTLGSKSNQSEMQIIVVKMKDILEQIKEQVLNVL